MLLSGTPKTYIKTAESSNKRLHAFGGNCGTPIYACAVDNPQSYGLRIGTITQRDLLTEATRLEAQSPTRNSKGGRAGHGAFSTSQVRT